MTDTRRYEDLSTDHGEREGRPSDLVADDLPEVDLGEQPEPDDQALLEEIEEALKDVVDPELGINVVDLGLVYGLHVEDDDSLTIDLNELDDARWFTREEVEVALSGHDDAAFLPPPHSAIARTLLELWADGLK